MLAAFVFEISVVVVVVRAVLLIVVFVIGLIVLKEVVAVLDKLVIIDVVGTVEMRVVFHCLIYSNKRIKILASQSSKSFYYFKFNYYFKLNYSRYAPT